MNEEKQGDNSLEINSTSYTIPMPDPEDPAIKIAEAHDELPQRAASNKLYTRGEIGTLLGMNHSTLARWEQKGLIAPAQRINNVCVYSEDQFQEIKKVWEQSSRNINADELCSICNRRKARVGSTSCSRCSYAQLETQLRSTLPGMEIKSNDRESTPSPVSTLHDSGVEESAEELSCSTCHSDDPAERNVVTTGPEEFPISLPCSDEFHNQEANAKVLGGLTPGVKYYTRRQIAQEVGVSPTTICRWEQKGEIPSPLRVAHNNQLYYTDEHLLKAKEYISLVEQVKPSPIVRAGKAVSARPVALTGIKIRGFRRGGLL